MTRKPVNHGWVCGFCNTDNQVALDEAEDVVLLQCASCGGDSRLVRQDAAFPKWRLEQLKPSLRRFVQSVIAGVPGTRRYETWGEEECQTRFTTTISHVGLVKLLLEKGGEFRFPLAEEEYSALVGQQIGIHFGQDGARLWLMDAASARRSR